MIFKIIYFPLIVTDYLNGIMESVMYLLLPPDIYGCNPIGVLAQDLVVQYVLVPVLNLISDPDFVNQYIVWLVSRNQFHYLRSKE